MTYKPLFLVLPILCILTSSISAYNLLMGTIQFPSTLASIPNVRIYHSGKIVKGKVDNTNRTITFSIPKYNNSQIRYSLVVTESIEFAMPKATKLSENPSNIIQYIKIPDGQDYKLYTLLLVPRFSDTGSPGKPSYQWRILNDRARFNNKIPDDTIIVIFDPAWVDSLQSDNATELPTITVTQDLSSEMLYEKSAQLLLAAIDSDTMHDANSQERVKIEQNRIMIAAPVA